MPARIELLALDTSTSVGDEHDVPKQMSELNIFRCLLRRPDIAARMSDLLLALLRGKSLPHRQRELMIMRIGWATGSDYEWTQHWTIARDWFELSEAELLAVRGDDAAGVLGNADRAVLAAVDDTLAHGMITGPTWQLCREHFDEEACLELVCAIGTWHMISEVTRSLEVPLEDGVANWPPDGEAPAADGARL